MIPAVSAWDRVARARGNQARSTGVAIRSPTSDYDGNRYYGLQEDEAPCPLIEDGSVKRCLGKPAR